jgi:small GTP-binding protein
MRINTHNLGQEEFDSLRVLSYPNTDVFLLCFSLIDVTSLKNIKSSWIKELQQHCATAKYSIILVGTKSDLRDESNKNHVTKEMGEELKQEIGAFDYVECSAMTNTNVKQLFEKIMDHKLAEKAEPKKEGGCCSIC